MQYRYIYTPKIKIFFCVCSFSCVIQIAVSATDDAGGSDGLYAILKLLTEYFKLSKKYVYVKVAISRACQVWGYM